MDEMADVQTQLLHLQVSKRLLLKDNISYLRALRRTHQTRNRFVKANPQKISDVQIHIAVHQPHHRKTHLQIRDVQKTEMFLDKVLTLEHSRQNRQ
jgi:hypothetical protein